jgi:Putative zincin peptidase
MTPGPEDLEDPSKYRQIVTVPYDNLIDFVLDYLRRKSGLMVFFWSVCLLTLVVALTVRINISGYYPFKNIMLHSTLGLIVFPLLSIPLHEILHVIPFFLAGARKIRVGMELKQYIFYVTAHRYVVNARQFRIIALVPFILVSIALFILVLFLPGLWKWSLSLLLFVHTTMCAGDFALLNLFWLNRKKKIYTWDDADEKMAYFYEEI